MSRLVLVGVFILIIASVVDGSSSSSRRSSRIRGSPRQSMRGLFRGLCSKFRKQDISDREAVVLVSDSTTTPLATEPTTVPTVTEFIQINGTEEEATGCYFTQLNNTQVKPELLLPEISNVTSEECSDLCNKDVTCITVIAYNASTLKCILNMGLLSTSRGDEDSCLASCMASPECRQAKSLELTCAHYNRVFYAIQLQTSIGTNIYSKTCPK